MSRPPEERGVTALERLDVARLWALAGLGGAALALGIVGYHGPDDVGDAGYKALQLFAFEYHPGAGPEAEVARYLAGAATGSALLITVSQIFRARLRAVRLRFITHGHIIVAGLGDLGAALAASLAGSGPVVAIDRDVEGNPRARALRQLGVHVLEGDARRPAILRRARLHRAQRMAVICGDDAENVNVFVAVKATHDQPRTLPVLLHVDDAELWLQLTGEIGPASQASVVRGSVFNLPDAAARELVGRHRRKLGDGPVLLLGDSLFLRRVAVHLARHAGPAGRTIHVGASQAGRVVAALATDPEIESRAVLVPHEVEQIDARGATTALVAELGERPVLTVVHGPDEPTGVAAGLAIERQLPGEGEVVIAVRDHRAGAATLLPLPGAACRAFGLVSETLTRELLDLDDVELLAQAAHEQYRELAQGGVQTAPSDVAWHELAPALQESSRRFAEDIARKLKRFGWLVVPAAVASGGEDLHLADGEVESLAEVEHERWCADLRAAGWRHGNQTDRRQRVHAQLVRWEALSEHERDKDRELVRALPSILALAGLSARRARTAAPPPGGERW